MLFKKTITLLCGCLLLSCQNVEHEPKPKNLIKEEKMVNVLVDLAKIDAAISLNAKKYRKRDVVGKKLLFKKYNIDSLQLVKSNAYYAEHFKINQRIYDSVRARLEREKDSLDALDKKAQEKAKEKSKKFERKTDDE